MGSTGTQAFLFDRATRASTLVSHLPGLPNTGGNQYSTPTLLTPDGRYMAFRSLASNLVAGAGPFNFDNNLYQAWRIHRWERLTGEIELVFRPTSSGCTSSPSASVFGGMTPDGSRLLLTTTCALVPGDFNGSEDVYLYDRVASQYELISHQPGNPAAAIGLSRALALSPDGRTALYGTHAQEIFSVTSGSPWLP